MGSKSLKKTNNQHNYEWKLRHGTLRTFDLSWPCLTASKLPSGSEMSAHREVVKAFKNMGVL